MSCTRFSLAALVILVVSPAGLAQKRNAVAVCRQTTFAALKTLPELQYDCPEGLIESDDKILKLPARLKALDEIVKELESWNDAAWWRASVDDLNVCEFHGRAGALEKEEREKLRDGDYGFWLSGDHKFRLVMVSDPCYQVGYSGSALFLLYNEGARVYVTKLKDGYYSRVDNSVGIDVANVNGQQIVELSTSNSMPPSIWNYYFVIDPRTHRAVPKNLFKDGGKMTNEVYSAMILGEPSELGLPRNAKDTVVMSHNRLLPAFFTYSEAYGEGDGRKLHRTVYRWNGRYYMAR